MVTREGNSCVQISCKCKNLIGKLFETECCACQAANRLGEVMQGKIALEEHFALEETVQDSAGFSPAEDWIELKARLLGIKDRRLKEMDAHGIELMLLSLNAPAIQAIPDRNRAVELCDAFCSVGAFCDGGLAGRSYSTLTKGRHRSAIIEDRLGIDLHTPARSIPARHRCSRESFRSRG